MGVLPFMQGYGTWKSLIPYIFGFHFNNPMKKISLVEEVKGGIKEACENLAVTVLHEEEDLVFPDQDRCFPFGKGSGPP